MPLALQTTQGMVLAHAIASELRARRILLPTVALIEKMCAIALARAEREAFRRSTLGHDGLSGEGIPRQGGLIDNQYRFRTQPARRKRRAVSAPMYRSFERHGFQRPIAHSPARPAT